MVGRPARIARAQVLAEALGLADEEGLEALTMAALAERLGVTPMALYRHVANKADLLDGVVEVLLTEFPPRPLGPVARAPEHARREHPGLGLPAPECLPPAAPATGDDRGSPPGSRSRLRALDDAGVPDDRVAQVERLVSTAVLGFAVSEAAGRFRDHSRRQLDADFAALQALLARFIEAQAAKEPSG